MILKFEMWADLGIIADQLTHGKYIGKSLLKWVNNANKCIITIIYISMGIFNSTLTNVYIFQRRGHCVFAFFASKDIIVFNATISACEKAKLQGVLLCRNVMIESFNLLLYMLFCFSGGNQFSLCILQK